MPDLTINGYRNNYGKSDISSSDGTQTKSIPGAQYDLVTGKIKPNEYPENQKKTDDKPKDQYKPSINSASKALTADQQKQIRQLQSTDEKVRSHEEAHMAAGGGLVRGGASFKYTTGPDGKQYAVAGEVSIDTSIDPNNPDSSIAKLERVKRAALAPMDPSSQDRSVASDADAKIASLEQQKAKKSSETALAQSENNQKVNEQFKQTISKENKITAQAYKSYIQNQFNYSSGSIINKTDTGFSA